MTERQRHSFRVVFYRHGAEWIGHCIDCDVVAVGETEEDAADAMADSLALLIGEALRTNDLSLLFAPAPRELWDMYAHSRKSGTRPLDVGPEQDAEILSAVA